jgi:hypothetical protein
MELTPEQRDEIQLLLEEELREARRAALARGATPADVGELLDDRRHAVDFLLLDVAEDAQHPDHHPVEGDGVGEQR